MDQIQELEKQLEQLRKQKRLENCIENLNRWKNDFIGKYYCTHTLSRDTLSRKNQNSTFICHAAKVKDVILSYNGVDEVTDANQLSYEDPSVCVLYEEIEITIKQDGQSTIRISNTYAKAHYARLYRHFITEEQYNKLKNIVNNSITDVLTSKLSEANGCDLPIDAERSSKSDVLSKYGHEMIDLTPEEVYQLSWHPFVYGDQIINNEISLQMILDELKKETNLDLHDVDFFVYGERVKRTGYHGKVANVYLSVINKMNKSI